MSVIDLRPVPERPGASPSDELQSGLSPEYLEFLGNCGHDPFSVDELVTRTKLTSAEVSSMLLILELQGYVESGPGGRYTRVSKRS